MGAGNRSKKLAGQQGEDIAASFLTSKGYEIVARNVWMTIPDVGRREVDLICRDNETLVFVEVRLRVAHDLNTAAQSLNPKKLEHMSQAAQAYIETKDMQGISSVRIDAVIIAKHGDSAQITHVKNVGS